MLLAHGRCADKGREESQRQGAPETSRESSEIPCALCALSRLSDSRGSRSCQGLRCGVDADESTHGAYRRILLRIGHVPKGALRARMAEHHYPHGERNVINISSPAPLMECVWHGHKRTQTRTDVEPTPLNYQEYRKGAKNFICFFLPWLVWATWNFSIAAILS